MQRVPGKKSAKAASKETVRPRIRKKRDSLTHQRCREKAEQLSPDMIIASSAEQLSPDMIIASSEDANGTR